MATRNVPTTLAAYKKLVREEALRVADEQGWCREGLNETLVRLGLEKKSSTWNLELEIELSIDAPDQDYALKAFIAAINGIKAKNSLSVQVNVLSPLNTTVENLQRCMYSDDNE